ncbi:MAG: hypothetical protein M3389_16330, partial [Actinomycetota bacterium]|nr:hypothetical protein [Actinomycetota bacterium]
PKSTAISFTQPARAAARAAADGLLAEIRRRARLRVQAAHGDSLAAAAAQGAVAQPGRALKRSDGQLAAARAVSPGAGELRSAATVLRESVTIASAEIQEAGLPDRGASEALAAADELEAALAGDDDGAVVEAARRVDEETRRLEADVERAVVRRAELEHVADGVVASLPDGFEAVERRYDPEHGVMMLARSGSLGVVHVVVRPGAEGRPNVLYGRPDAASTCHDLVTLIEQVSEKLPTHGLEAGPARWAGDNDGPSESGRAKASRSRRKQASHRSAQ